MARGWVGRVGKRWPRRRGAIDAAKNGVTAQLVTLAHNEKSEAEVDVVVLVAKAAGGTVIREPAPTEWGGYSGYFSDPDGHLWEVAHNPLFRVGPWGLNLVSLPEAVVLIGERSAS